MTDQKPPMMPPVPTKPPPWMLIAQSEVGIKEIPGPDMHPRIREYYKATDMGVPADDTVPWCSAFANWCVKQAGIKGTNKANARSWLNWGSPLQLPKLGCIVVFSRPPGPANGHVAFYAGTTPTGILVLGGNQSNRVSTAVYPKERLLAYRWPLPGDFIVKK